MGMRRLVLQLAVRALLLVPKRVAADGLVNAAEAQPTAPLTLAEVLDSVNSTHPKAEIADINVRKAEGKVLSASGGWDPSLSVSGRWLPLGYYEYGQLDVSVKQATPLWGLGIYGGYRAGLGDFPVYKGELQTLNAGELRVGVDLPLWRDRAIDEQRAGVASSEALLGAVECKRATTDLDLERDAALAYWRWVATGLEVAIQRELLTVAEQRDQALRDQAQLGSVAQIVVVDNARLMLGRKAELVNAKLDFAQAGVKLSLYFRDTKSKPVRPNDNRLPKQIADLGDARINYGLDLASALGSRPELCELRRAREAARVELQLAQNQVAPQVNAQAFVARDLGDGPTELRPTDFGVGVTLSMPLGLRKARGQSRSAEAELASIDAKLRGLADQITAEFQLLLVELRAAAEQVELAQELFEVAKDLAAAERERFAQGASDLVVVNLRETAAADAGRQYIEAKAELQSTWAKYRRATATQTPGPAR